MEAEVDFLVHEDANLAANRKRARAEEVESKTPPSARDLRAAARRGSVGASSDEASPPPAKKQKSEESKAAAEVAEMDTSDDEKKDEQPSKAAAAPASPAKDTNLCSALLSRQLGQRLSPQRRERLAAPFTKFLSTFALTTSGKVFTSDRVQTFALHDSQPVAVCGSKGGTLAAWRFPARRADAEAELVPPSVLAEQRSRISEVRMHPQHAQLAFSACYGGEVVQVDLGLPQFTPQAVIRAAAGGLGAGDDESDSAINSMDVAGDLVFAGSEDGILHVRDLRMSEASQLQLHRKKVSTVNVDPRNPHALVSAANRHLDGPALCLYDLRKLAPSMQHEGLPLPLQTIDFDRVVKASAFSPSGSKLLATSMDDTVSVYSVHAQSLTRTTKFAHRNQTGIWISDFRPKFHPKDENLLLIGELGTHCISLHDCTSGRKAVTFAASGLNAVTSLAEFHASYDAMVSFSYGKGYVWHAVPQAD